MPQSLSNVYIHLIFSTKDRAPTINPVLKTELHAYLAAILQDLNSPAVVINSVADHVHLLFKLSRTVTISKAVEEVKKSSSKWMKTKGAGSGRFSWQAGYAAFSVSESNTSTVAHYIRNQERHHKRKSFQDEFREFLVKNGVEFDEQYLWD